MATVNFRLRKVKKDKYPILIYLSLGRNNIYQVKTGFTINPNHWSNSTKRPKQNNESTKKLFNDLLKLETHIFDNLNDSNSKGEVIDRYWLESSINNCFDRIDSTDQNNFLIYQTEYIINNANTKKIRGSNKIGLSKNTIKGYNTFLNTIKKYEAHIKKKIRLTDISNMFVENFTNWLMNDNHYSINHTGKQISLLKTVCLDAKRREVKTHLFVDQIESFTEAKENKYIITLNFDELEIIKNKELTKDYLINARKWLLLGCEIGQRCNDLLNLNRNNMRYINKMPCFDVYQQKTGKTITAPVVKSYIEEFIIKDFPHKISEQKLNNYIKELCAVAEINEPTKGKKFNSDINRKQLGTYPKYELITTHTFRRSFATNYYKLLPTPVLMDITGHTKESTFLEYIGKPKDKDENAKLFIKLALEVYKEKKSKLKVI